MGSVRAGAYGAHVRVPVPARQALHQHRDGAQPDVDPGLVGPLYLLRGPVQLAGGVGEGLPQLVDNLGGALEVLVEQRARTPAAARQVLAPQHAQTIRRPHQVVRARRHRRVRVDHVRDRVDSRLVAVLLDPIVLAHRRVQRHLRLRFDV
eukprot:2238764-Rhodomonas_salina.2